MRVISGRLRGMKLDAPAGLGTRPTLDRVKEAVFSMLFDRTADACVLDLFAGSGALGIEALSRYAAHCVFVDSSPEAQRIVRANVSKAHLSEETEIVACDSLRYLSGIGRRFDIIFIDPPYEAGLYDEVLNIISERNLLAPGGVVVAECSADYNLKADGFGVLREKKYGNVKIYILEGRDCNE